MATHAAVLIENLGRLHGAIHHIIVCIPGWIGRRAGTGRGKEQSQECGQNQDWCAQPHLQRLLRGQGLALGHRGHPS